MTKGVLYSLFASCLFGLLYYYPVLLKPLESTEIFSWRILLSLPAIAILITLERSWGRVNALLQRIKAQPKLLFGLLSCSAILAIEMLLFVWAPLNGRALSTSLGYFILPLTIAISGRIFFKEKLSPLQILAMIFALIGVVIEIFITRAFSWDTAVVFTGYPIYLVLRKILKTEGIEGFFFDLFFIAIGTGIFLFWHDRNALHIFVDYPKFIGLVPLLGVITASAFAIYFAAGRLLPLGLFGLLGYIEPLIFVFISLFVLHEQISEENMLSYLMIFISIGVLIVDGVLFALKSVKHRKHVLTRIQDSNEPE